MKLPFKSRHYSALGRLVTLEIRMISETYFLLFVEFETTTKLTQ